MSLQTLFDQVRDETEKIETRPYINTARIEKARWLLTVIRTNLKPFATEQKDIKQIKEYQACLKKLEDTIRLKNKK